MDKSLANELIEINKEQAQLLGSWIQKDAVQEMSVITSGSKTKSWTVTHYMNLFINFEHIKPISLEKASRYATTIKLSNVGEERVLIPVHFNGMVGHNSFHFFSNLIEYFSFWNFQLISFSWKSLSELIIKSSFNFSNNPFSKYRKTKQELLTKKEAILKEDLLNTSKPQLPHELFSLTPPIPDSINEQKIAIYQITTDDKWYFCTPGKWLDGIYDEGNGGAYGIPLLKDATTLVIYCFPSKKSENNSGCIWGQLLQYDKIK
ncbi:MAG: hypothetical protein V4572_04980 [Bacteroidota bacterium]